MTEPGSTARYWDDFYREPQPGCTGAANPVLVDLVRGVPAGTALDLGCGEGNDALWLAHRGWKVTAIDISATVLSRVAERAAAAGLTDRIVLQRHDLAKSLPDGAFDLVSAQYLHSPVDFPRAAVLRAAARTVNRGGLLLVVGHAGPPPWHNASEDHARELPHFPSAQEVVTSLALPPAEWHCEVVECRKREATGPDGQIGILTDTVVAMRAR